MQPILNEADQKAINGFAGRLKTIAESELGELFKDTQNENVIDLCQSIECNDVIFFSLNSLVSLFSSFIFSKNPIKARIYNGIAIVFDLML